MKTNLKNFRAYLAQDLPAGLVVFLVAVPLCLGIAFASGAPMISGLLAGIIGGLIIGLLSDSPLSVSGPAAGLVGIVIVAVEKLGSFEAFLLAVFVAGIFQLIMGLAKMGSIANYFPTNVIKGMLSAIGIIIILKQIPHFFGYDRDVEGDLAFLQIDGENTISELFRSIQHISIEATIIGLISLLILILWEKPFFRRKLPWLPGALLAVLFGILANIFLQTFLPQAALSKDHLVQMPVIHSPIELFREFKFPDFTQWKNPEIYIQAITIAIVASIETLLCLEAVDKLDPHKRHSSANRELLAQGVGNSLAGLIGALPITSVIVRSSANVNSGGQTKTSTIFHGLLLLISVLFLSSLINLVPLSSLAAVLLMVGYKLSKVSIYKEMYAKGRYQWWPFIITVVAVVLTNLLTGVCIGLAVSIFSLLRKNLKNSYFFHKEKFHSGEAVYIHLSEEVSFLNKASIKKTLDQIPANTKVILDASGSYYIDYDVLEVIRDFQEVIAKEKNIEVISTGFQDTYLVQNTQNVIFKPKEEIIKQNIENLITIKN